MKERPREPPCAPGGGVEGAATKVFAGFSAGAGAGAAFGGLALALLGAVAGGLIALWDLSRGRRAKSGGTSKVSSPKPDRGCKMRIRQGDYSVTVAGMSAAANCICGARGTEVVAFTVSHTVKSAGADLYLTSAGHNGRCWSCFQALMRSLFGVGTQSLNGTGGAP